MWIELLVAAASAAALPTVPGTAQVVGACQPDPAAACWSTATRLQRWAPDHGLLLPALELDVRVAHRDGALLVRTEGLPAGSRLELAVSPGTGEAPPKTSVLVAQPTDQAARVHNLLPSPGLRPPQLRALRLSLIGADGSVRAWAPAGPGDLTDPALLALAPGRPSPQPPLQVRLDDGHLHVSAAGATSLRVEQERMAFPASSTSIPPAWSASGADALAVHRPPDAGWYLVEALWRDAAQRPTWVERARVWLDADAPTGLAAWDIHPAPFVSQGSAAPPFRLDPHTRIALAVEAWRPAGELLADELERMTGIRPPIVERARRGDLWLGGADAPLPRRLLAADVSLLMLGQVNDPQHFAIALSERGGVARAADRAAATWAALALADAIGADGQSPAFTAADHPVVARRVAYQDLVARNAAPLDVGEFRHLIRRVLTRGRYTDVVLAVMGGLRFATLPELSPRGAMGPDDVRMLVAAATELGINAIPGANAPGHAQWLTRAYPELAEDMKGEQVCTRLPLTWSLLDRAYQELFDLFTTAEGPPRWFHIGHDEVYWRTDEAHEEHRCPRCAATPRWRLFGESLNWHIDWLAARGAQAMMWSDMLAPGWNGGRHGVDRAGTAVDPAIRGRVLVMSWGTPGDSEAVLTPLGYPVGRVHTGYTDWKRDGLGARIGGPAALAAEGLAIFNTTPWSNRSGRAGSRAERTTWSNLILAGATAWRPDLVDTPIDATLRLVHALPAYRPGHRHPRGRRQVAVAASGGGAWPGADVALPAALSIGGTQVALSAQAVLHGAPVLLDLPAPVATLGLVVAVDATLASEQRWAATFGQLRSPEGDAVLHVELQGADGSRATIGLRPGMELPHVDATPHGALLWRASAATWAPSAAGAPDRVLALVQLVLPGAEITGARLSVVDSGHAVLLAGAVGWSDDPQAKPAASPAAP